MRDGRARGGLVGAASLAPNPRRQVQLVAPKQSLPQQASWQRTATSVPASASLLGSPKKYRVVPPTGGRYARRAPSDTDAWPV